MKRASVLNRLKELHTELTSSFDVPDEELRTTLKGIAEEIEIVIGEESAEIQSGREQLVEIAVKFETDHPRVAGILTEIADTLGKLGF